MSNSVTGKKVYGYMIMEFDPTINEWKPINPSERLGYHPWNYTKHVAEQISLTLETHFRDDYIMFEVADVRPAK